MCCTFDVAEVVLTLLDDESVKEMRDALVKILREEYEKSKNK